MTTYTEHHVAANLIIGELNATTRQRDEVVRQIAPLEERRQRHEARIEMLQRSLERLQDSPDEEARAVEYSPADGEQAPRFEAGEKVLLSGPTAGQHEGQEATFVHQAGKNYIVYTDGKDLTFGQQDVQKIARRTAKYAKGNRVRYTGEGPHRTQVGEIVNVQEVHQSMDYAIWYEVTFPDKQTITISEDKLRPARKTMKHPNKNGPLLVEDSQYQLNRKGHRWDTLFVTIETIISKDRVEVHREGRASFVHPSELA